MHHLMECKHAISSASKATAVLFVLFSVVLHDDGFWGAFVSGRTGRLVWGKHLEFRACETARFSFPFSAYRVVLWFLGSDLTG